MGACVDCCACMIERLDQFPAPRCPLGWAEAGKYVVRPRVLQNKELSAAGLVGRFATMSAAQRHRGRAPKRIKPSLLTK